MPMKIMPCPVSLVPFHLVIGNGNFRSVRDLSRDGNVVAALDLEEVGFVGVGLANTRPWDCQVASSLETIFAREGASFPLAIISCSASGTACATRTRVEAVMTQIDWRSRMAAPRLTRSPG